MTHRTMESNAKGLADRGIATLRYQFPYMERGGKRPDAPALAHATVRAAVAEAARLLPQLPLIASGTKPTFYGLLEGVVQPVSDIEPGAMGQKRSAWAFWSPAGS